MRKSGKNGLGQTPDEAYGEQYDKLRKAYESDKKSEPDSGG